MTLRLTDGNVRIVERIVRAHDPDELAPSIVLAFAADPFVRWLFASPAAFLRFFSQITRLHGQATAPAGGVWAREDGRGAAFWYPPAVRPPADALGAVLAEAGIVDRVTAVFARVADHVPPGPCWYLRQIGVDPALQGRGHGAALLAAGLAEIDDRGEAAYLEATSEASRRFYARHDFEHVGTAQAGGSPPLWVMVRAARRPAAGD